MTDYLAAIDNRVSTRSFESTAIDNEKRAALEAEINAVNEKFKLSISLIEDGGAAFMGFRKSYGMFKGVRALIVLKGPQDDIHLKEKLGYAGELIVLRATLLGLGTCWVGGTFERSNPIFAAQQDEAFVCVIAVGNGTEKKTLIGNIIGKMKRSKAIESFYTADAAVPEWFMAGIKAVQKAPSAMNAQKVHLTYLNGQVKAAVPESYPLDLVDLGIAKLHFELASGTRFNFGNNAGQRVDV